MAVALLAGLSGGAAAQEFTDVTDAAGLAGPHGVVIPGDNLGGLFVAGAAVGDVDGDGLHDIFWTGGTAERCRLYINQGDGSFVETGMAAGIAYQSPTSGPMMFDADADGDLDVFVSTYQNILDLSSAEGPVSYDPLQLESPVSPATPPLWLGVGVDNLSGNPGPRSGLAYRNLFFLNRGDGTFAEVWGQPGRALKGRFGSTAGDLDGDGRIDLVTTEWGSGPTRLYRNVGGGRVRDVTPAHILADIVWGFSPNIVDYDDDGDADMVNVNDLLTSRIWRNDGNGVWTDFTAGAGVGTDQNGMGSALADYDGDGDLDWFITAIFHTFFLPGPGYGNTGNRLFRNDGNGTFTDVTDAAGVREGGWGWGAQFADIDNDGDEDLIHANGWTEPGIQLPLTHFLNDRLRVFVNQGDGTFVDAALAFGLDDPDQGRGLAVFDADGDGALDILVANYLGGLTLWQNDKAAVPGRWLEIVLQGGGENRLALGARLLVEADGLADQHRWVLRRSNYLGHGPIDQWVGLGAATSADVTVTWPDGQVSVHPGLAADQRHVLTQP